MTGIAELLRGVGAQPSEAPPPLWDVPGVEPDFDVIVVGGGVAGAVAAYELAGEGHEVLLVERGQEPGSKNLSGGVLYCRVLEEIFPNFLRDAPVERKITRNQLMFLNRDSSVAVDYRDARLVDPVNAVTVLRAKLDPWLSEKCEEAGVTVMSGVRVDSLIERDGQFVGVRAGDDELYSRVVIAADGVNSFLSRDAGLRGPEPKNNLAVGVKSVIGLDPKVIEERFQVKNGEGAAYAVVGGCTKGIGGGGFLYTNIDSVSAGVVLRLDDLERSGESSSQLHDHFLTHPVVSPLLAGGELLEYGCHLVAEGGASMQHDLVAPGLLIVGDAAGFTLNTGFTVRGMDLAAGSALAAAKSVDLALRNHDVGHGTLDGYISTCNESFVGRDMNTYRNAPAFLESPEMYDDVGQLAADVMYKIYGLDMTPRKHLLPTVASAVRSSNLSFSQLASIGFRAMRAL